MIGSEFVELNISAIQRISIRACEIEFVSDNVEVLENGNKIERRINGCTVGFGGRTVTVQESYDEVLRQQKMAEM